MAAIETDDRLENWMRRFEVLSSSSDRQIGFKIGFNKRQRAGLRKPACSATPVCCHAELDHHLSHSKGLLHLFGEDLSNDSTERQSIQHARPLVPLRCVRSGNGDVQDDEPQKDHNPQHKRCQSCQSASLVIKEMRDFHGHRQLYRWIPPPQVISTVSAHVEPRKGAGPGPTGSRLFPFPAHQTGQARFEHPAFRQTSPTSSRKSPEMPVTQAQHAQVPEHNRVREAGSAARRHLVAMPQEVPHAFIDVIIDRSIGHQPRPVTEVVRPPMQNSVESISHVRPRCDVMPPQQVSTFCRSQETLFFDGLAPTYT